MQVQFLLALLAGFCALPASSAPAESQHRLGKHQWLEDLGGGYFARCEWKKESIGGKLKMVHCVNFGKVHEGDPVAGPVAGDFDPEKVNIGDVKKPGLGPGKPDTLGSKPTIQLVIVEKEETTQWMNCSTVAQNSRYFGGHNSDCTQTVKWADIPVGERILKFGKKANSTECHFPQEIGGEEIDGGPPAEEKRDAPPDEPSFDKDTMIADQSKQGTNYGRYKYINGTTYLLSFRQQHAFDVTNWSEIPLGAYVYNVGFKSTDEEPMEENPWVDHCVHVSCLRCEQKGCDDQFAVTIPGAKEESICQKRDEEGMCVDWQRRENDPEGQRRLCEMRIQGFC